MFRSRFLIALGAIATVVVLIAGDAHARAGGGFSLGSRGMRTFSMPPTTRTAPGTAAPITRSITQPGSSNAFGSPVTRSGLFGGGLFGGLAAGFLGAGLFGLLFGHGFFGGMGGFASLLGLALQIVLMIFVVRLIAAWWQRRHTPAYAVAYPATGYGSAGLGGTMGVSAPTGEQQLTIVKTDYDAFERLLREIQSAYSAEDLSALRPRVTPEMFSYFCEPLTETVSRGLVNVKLLQGALAEAWREGDTDYATVAMRFALTDSMVERTSGRTVEGGSPSEVAEVWTFRRAHGGNWLLSAIQQT